MKILFIESHDLIRQRFTLCLDNLPLDIEVVEVASEAAATEALAKNGPFELIICGHDQQRFNAAAFYAKINPADLEIPFIILGEAELGNASELQGNFKRNPLNLIISKKSTSKDFSTRIWSVIKKKNNLNFEYEEEEYKKVRLIYFLRFNQVLCDVYVRLNEQKYIKIINKDEFYTREDFRKYTQRNIEYLYILSEDYEGFGVSMAKTPFLIENKNMASEQVEHAVSTTVEIIHDLASTVGITDTVLNLVDYSVYQIEAQLEESTNKKAVEIYNLMTKIRDRKDYLYDHSYMLSYMACEICTHLDWDSEETRNKLIYASLLKDIKVGNADLAMAVDLQSSELLKFSEEEIAKYKKHPLEAAQMIAEAKAFPLNIEDLVAQHHENPEGTGFPRKLEANRVNQLSATFIVAHNFVNELYREDFNKKEIINILSRMKKRFSVGPYKAPVMALIRCFPREAKMLLELVG